ncbi:MAG: alpha/beta hydrolase [Planctomycetaceae bacterium]|nr:alpha/beta hydrolase [Planctomycetaceae bacterium]
MKTPLFLFPGLACNERLFATQRDGLNNILNVIIPEWVRPTSKDQVESFALRWAEYVWETYYSENALPANRQDPALGCYVGGHSFGGMCAPIVGEFLEKKGVKVHACFRFACADKPNDISWKWMFLGRALNIFPDGTWLTIKTFCRLRLFFTPKYTMSDAKREMYLQIIETPVRRSFHIVRMLYSWKRSKEHKFQFPTFCIRGKKDSVVPPQKRESEVILPHAGHGMCLTQGAKLNDFIRNFVMNT